MMIRTLLQIMQARGKQNNLFKMLKETIISLCFMSCKILRVQVHACSVVSDSLRPWTPASQAPLSMGFSWQEYWLPFPPPGDLLIRGIEPWDQTHVSCVSQIAGRFFTAELLGKPSQPVKIDLKNKDEIKQFHSEKRCSLSAVYLYHKKYFKSFFFWTEKKEQEKEKTCK